MFSGLYSESESEMPHPELAELGAPKKHSAIDPNT